MRYLTIIVMAVVTAAGACGSGETAFGIDPGEVRVGASVEYSSDGPPIAVEVSVLEPADGVWAVHEIEIRGAQIEWVVVAELGGREYRAADGTLIATDVRDDRLVVLRFEDTVSVRVVLPAELAPGTHVYELALPVWLDPVGDVPDQPDDVVTVNVQYDVQSPDVRAEVASFCDVAVPLMNARTPTLPELDRIIEVAESELEPTDQAAITAQAEALAESLKPESGSSYGYSTGDLNNVIEQLCNVTMLSISAVE